MSSVLLPSVAGMFYPEQADELRQQVDSLLAESPVPDEPPPKALIAPHAGYIYSGPVAASAYRRLLPAADSIERVVILAPSHRVPFAAWRPLQRIICVHLWVTSRWTGMLSIRRWRCPR